MATYAPVHGGWHSGACWNMLSPFWLTGDTTSSRWTYLVTIPRRRDYARVVCNALTGCRDDVVLVGRSMGGQTIRLVAARRPVLPK